MYLKLQVIFLFFFLNQLNGQEIKTNVKRNFQAKLKVVYQIRTDNELLHGNYCKYYKRKKQAEGKYINGLREGKWIFTNASYKMTGDYMNGKKIDRWLYYKNDILTAVKNYNSLNKVTYDTAFYTDGKIKAIRLNNSIDSIYRTYGYSNEGIVKFYCIQENKIHKSQYMRRNENNEKTLDIIFMDGTPFSLLTSSFDSTELINYKGKLLNGNGNLKTYKKNTDNGKYYLISNINYADSKFNGFYQNHYNNGNLKIEGQFKNGYLDGEWKIYEHKYPKSYKTKKYKILDSLKCDSSETKMIYFEEEEYANITLPKFYGKNIDDFRYFITSNLVYLVEEINNRKNRDVMVQFYIDAVGEAVEPKIIKSAGPYFDKEAIRIVNLSPNWTPGFDNGIPVKTIFTFPILFRLR